MNTHMPANYPYPDMYTEINSYDDEAYYRNRLVWRQGLSDVNVRAMASDYRLGKITEENYDAHQEFLARGLDKQDQLRRESLKAPKRKRRR